MLDGTIRLCRCGGERGRKGLRASGHGSTRVGSGPDATDRSISSVLPSDVGVGGR
jgi:hypothetical protein